MQVGRSGPFLPRLRNGDGRKVSKQAVTSTNSLDVLGLQVAIAGLIMPMPCMNVMI